MASFAPLEERCIRMRHPTPLVSLSVVSHGQGSMLHNLLGDLRSLSDLPHEILVTINIPEDTGFLAEFSDLPITVICNQAPKGFGANHNAAFGLSKGKFFSVVNPDIRAVGLRLRPLVATLENAPVGACAPTVLSAQGQREDNVRRFPTVTRMFSRVVLKRRAPDYVFGPDPMAVDWVAGMFVVFRRDAFEDVRGFDERFFMYLEDVDICRRLKRSGWATMVQPAVSVIHDAQRASHRSLRHLRWHMTSMARYLTGF